MKREVIDRRPWVARLTLVAVLVGFLGLAARVVVTLAAADLVEQKLAGAERFLYYRVTPTNGPTFQLAGDETSIRLVTHAVLPTETHYDPAVEYEYGIRVAIDLGGKTWQRDVYTRSRQSKARLTSGKHPIWLDENTFSLDDDLQLTDDRLLVIALPSHIPAGATARVTLLGDLHETYVRAYTPVPRDDAARRARDLPVQERNRIAAQVSYLPWDRLTTPEDLASLRFIEQRLSAEGKEGIDYQTRTLYTTGFRVRASTMLERGVLVTADHAVAINVVGPARVDLTVTRPAAFSADAGTLDVELVGEGTLPVPLAVALPVAGASVTRAIEIPEGVFTLSLVATAPARIELVPPATKPVALGGAAGAPLVPDEQASTAYLADPQGAPIQIAVDGPEDVLGHVLRIDVRALAAAPIAEVPATKVTRWPGSIPPAAAPAAQPIAIEPIGGTITIETLDAAGLVMTTATAKFESQPSRFETAKLFGKLAVPVCEPVGVRFLVPPGGRSIRVRTDRAALVQALTPIAISPPADQLAPPYDAVPLVTMKWRFARYLERGWLALRAHNHDELAPERVALVLSQARLEARVVPVAPDLRGTSIVPAGHAEQQTVIERVDAADAADFIAKWDDGHYTRLVPNHRMMIDFSKLPTRPTIRYRADDAVGTPVSIAIDDQTIDDKLSAARGTLRLPSGLTGVHALTVQASASVQLLLDRPPAPKQAAELYALRSVYEIGKSRHVRLRVEKRGATKQNINVLVYTSRPAAQGAVHITVDGGQPARVSGLLLQAWTLADRTLPMPPADRAPTLGFADKQGAPLYPRRLVISLGDDLPAGTHTIDVSVAGDDVWARFFTLDDAPLQARALQWRDTAEETP